MPGWVVVCIQDLGEGGGKEEIHVWLKCRGGCWQGVCGCFFLCALGGGRGTECLNQRCAWEYGNNQIYTGKPYICEGSLTRPA